MKERKLLAVILAALLSLSGCGIYTSAASSGVPKEPEVGQSNGIGSVAEEIRPDPVVSTPAETKPAQPSASTRLTKTQAEEIALKHEGFTAEQVKGLKSELDVDRGVPHYEVEFRVGQWEYDYDIHAETGAVLSFEKDD